MNAVTTTEARAVNTAASSAANVLQAADPSKYAYSTPSRAPFHADGGQRST